MVGEGSTALRPLRLRMTAAALIQRDWRAQLANFVIDLPPFDRCAEDLRTLVYELTGQDDSVLLRVDRR